MTGPQATTRRSSTERRAPAAPDGSAEPGGGFENGLEHSREVDRVTRLRAAAAQAAQLRELQTRPEVIALRVERVATVVSCFMWAGILLALSFTMVNVQGFAAGDAPHDSPAWWAAWLLDPMVSFVLVAILVAEQTIARYQVTPGGWVRTAKWACLAATYTMNTWSAWSVGDGHLIFLHSIPPLVVFVGAEAVTDLRVKLTEATLRAAQAVQRVTPTPTLPELDPSGRSEAATAAEDATHIAGAATPAVRASVAAPTRDGSHLGRRAASAPGAKIDVDVDAGPAAVPAEQTGPCSPWHPEPGPGARAVPTPRANGNDGDRAAGNTPNPSPGDTPDGTGAPAEVGGRADPERHEGAAGPRRVDEHEHDTQDVGNTGDGRVDDAGEPGGAEVLDGGAGDAGDGDPGDDDPGDDDPGDGETGDGGRDLDEDGDGDGEAGRAGRARGAANPDVELIVGWLAAGEELDGAAVAARLGREMTSRHSRRLLQWATTSAQERGLLLAHGPDSVAERGGAAPGTAPAAPPDEADSRERAVIARSVAGVSR